MLMLDITWITNRIALGGAIWDGQNMAELARLGITHIVDMQIEFDDTRLAQPYGIAVCWNPTDDDFQPKPPELFRRGVEFAQQALDEPDAKLYVHCAAGVHRGPMMALAILCSTGWDFDAAVDVIETKRAVADFPEVYLDSVKGFLQQASIFKS
jgi:protein-tyrosine phosphatase